VAETCSAVLCGAAGIEGRTIENQAAYCRGWLRAVQENRRAFVGQAGKGIEAARYILGEDDPRGADQAAHQEREEQEKEARDLVAA
jgi:antirestriction protein ArdC